MNNSPFFQSGLEEKRITAIQNFRIALAGQPNMGKSTLFNLLTGLNQHVGNWPGKTVERKEGLFTYNRNTYHLVDLPGTYSLTANSPEEVIAREYILREQPDAIIVMVNAASLEHSLYLVSEIICLSVPMVIALNMMDVAEHEMVHVEPEVLEAALGVPVIPMVATRTQGVYDLLATIETTLAGEHSLQPRLPEIDMDEQKTIDKISKLIDGYVPSPYPLDWASLKLLEGDNELIKTISQTLPKDRWNEVNDVLASNEDALLSIASSRYEWVGRMVRAAVVQPKLGQLSLTSKIDQWATHPFWGIVLLAAMLGLTFWLTFTIGSPIQQWLDGSIISPLAEETARRLAGSPFWVKGLLIDGIIGGVGSVLTFLPILIIFFAMFSVFEDVGYMARAAYVMDNFMHLMGLHGKSFLPLFLGFGCNVPAVVGTRVIESHNARILTILLAPLVPCTARMAVVAFLAPAFFGQQAALVSWSLVFGSLSILVVSGILLNHILFKGELSAFIMEMPLYHQPNFRTIGLAVWQRSLSFITKAGTIILLISVVVWALSVLPGGELQSSYLVQFGEWLEPLGKWMGLDWRLTVALLTSFIAKENSIAVLGVLFGSSGEEGLANTLAGTYSAATALAFLTVSILFIPCAATVAVIRQETGSWRWTLVNFSLLFLISMTAAVIVYQGALAFGL